MRPSAVSWTPNPSERAGALEVAAEARRALDREVVDADLVERPAGAREERVDIARDEARADEPDPRRTPPAAGEPVSRRRRERRGARRTDDRRLDAGEGVARVVVVEDEHRRRPRDPGRDVAREARDPLHAVHAEAPAERRRQGDDPIGRTVGEAKERRRRVHGVAVAVEPVGLLDDRDDLPLPTRQGGADLAAGDDRERRHGDRGGARRRSEVVVGRGRRGEGSRRGHREDPPASAVPPATRTGSASAASTSRDPVNGSRPCAVRTLSTSSRSPACHGSRTVWRS